MNIDISRTSDGKNREQTNGESLRLRGCVLSFKYPIPYTCRKIVVDFPHLVECHVGLSLENIDAINGGISFSITERAYVMFPQPETFFVWSPTVRGHIRIADRLEIGDPRAGIFLADYYEQQFGVILEPVSFVTENLLPQIITRVNYL